MAALVDSNLLLVPRAPRDFTSLLVPDVRRVTWHLKCNFDDEDRVRTVEVRSNEDTILRVFNVARGTDAGRQATPGGWYLIWTSRGDFFRLGWLIGQSELDPHEYWFAHASPRAVWDAVQNLPEATDLVFRCDFVSGKQRISCLPLQVRPECEPSIAGALLRLVNAQAREVREIFKTKRKLQDPWVWNTMVRDTGGD